MATDLQKASATALKIMEENHKKVVKPIGRCPQCGKRLKPFSNFYRCSNCYNDFMRTPKGILYIWDRTTGDPMPKSGVPCGEWVEWSLYEPEKVSFT